MHRARTLLALAALMLGGPTFEEVRNGITAGEIRAHLFMLSSDGLAGRAPGTAGGRLAADYLKSQLMRAGLEPVNGSYFQEVPLVGTTVDPSTVSLTFDRDGRRVEGTYPEDTVLWVEGAGASAPVDGELVFVGYGSTAPEWNWDDFEGRDLTGKVLLVLVGDPPSPPDEPELFRGRDLTYYGRWSYKLEEARRRGAAGALLVHDEAAGYDWNVVKASWTGEQLHLDREGEEGEPPPLELQGWVRRDLAARALDLGGLDLEELSVRAARRDFRPVPTGLAVRGQMEHSVRRTRAPNVVGLVPGRHPERGDEVVVLTAHYDHLGTGRPVDGDSIYNGAYDNASGVSVLLEIGEAFGQLDEGPDRGILVLATTGEEQGLLGARHYVRRPLIPLRRTVAVVNVDGANLWGPTDDVIVPGLERSTLGELVRARADELALEVLPDPAPEAGAYFRSDHFPFALAGVPALWIQHGLLFRGRPPEWGRELVNGWAERHAHQPSDEYDPEADLGGAVQQARFVFSVVYDIASAADRPRWRDPASPRSP